MQWWIPDSFKNDVTHERYVGVNKSPRQLLPLFATAVTATLATMTDILLEFYPSLVVGGHTTAGESLVMPATRDTSVASCAEWISKQMEDPQQQ